MTFSALVLAVVAMVWIGTPAAAATTTEAPDAGRYYEDAIGRYQAGDYNAAVIQLKNVLQLEPGNLPARLLLGQTYLRLGDGAAAEKELTLARKGGADDNLVLVPLGRALLMQGNYAKVLGLITPGGHSIEVEAGIQRILGEAHVERREFDQAERAFLEASRLHPENVEPLLGRARILVNRGEIKGAESLVDRAAGLAPDDPMVWSAKGEIRLLTRDLAGARAAFDRAVSLKDDYWQARLSRAAVRIDQGDLDGAMADLKAVLQIVPNEPQAAYLVALVLARKGRMKDAQSVLAEAAMALSNAEPDYLMNHPPSLLLAGVVNYAQKHYDDALLYLSRYIELVPYHAGSRKLVASILIDKGEFARAVSVIEPATRLAPDDAEVFSVYGAALMAEGAYSRAVSALEKATKLAPDQARVRTELAMGRLASGQSEAGIADLEAAFALDPKASRPGIVLGLTLLRQRDYERALKVAAALRKRMPKSPLPDNIAGAALLGLRDGKGARKALEHALEIDPTYIPAYFNLARLDRAEGKVESAKARLKAVLGIKRDETRALIALARIAEDEGRLDDATGWLEEVRNLHPEEIKPQLHLITLYLRARRPEAALIVAREIEARDQLAPWVLVALARAELAGGEFSRAIDMLRDVAERVADQPKALHRVALVQLQAEDWSGARKSLGRVLRAKPDYLPARISLVDLEARSGNTAKALSLAAKLSREHPEAAGIDLLRGDVLVKAKRYSEAARAYAAGLGKEPKTVLALRLYRARRLAGDVSGALAFLQGWVADHAADAAARKALAAAYIRAHDYRRAIANHEALLASSPDDPGLLNNLAWLYQKVGDPRAVTYAQRAYAQRPDDPATLDTYGWVLVQSDQPKKGLRLLREAYARASNNPEVRYHLAVALNALGRTTEARRELKAVLDGGADFEGKDDARTLLLRLAGG